jgi:hypothetical protein
MLVPYQQFAQKAKKLIGQYATISDEPVVFLDLWLAIYMHILQVENKLLLLLLSIESEEGGGDQQMTPDLLIEAFSAKSTQFIQSKRRKEPCNIALETSK